MTQAMTKVLVVEFDEMLRGALHDILMLADHYAVTEVSDEAAALAHLAAARTGLVAVCSNQDADHHRSAAFFAAVAADERLRMRHRYILLSTNPDQLPSTLQADLTYLEVPVLAKPFDMDALLGLVRQAEQRLSKRPSRKGRSHIWSRMRSAGRRTGR